MYWLTTVLQSLIVPPGLFILFGIFVVVFLAFRRNRVALWLSVVGLVLALALSLEPVAGLLLRPLEDRYAPVSLEEGLDALPEDVSHIVLLGGGSVPGAPEAPGGSLSPDALKRAVYAHRWHMQTGVPLLVTGGAPPGLEDALSEAEITRDLMLSLGATEDQFILESRSRDTWENALYSDELISNATILLVTSAYHMPRAVRSFAAFGFTVVPAPTDYKVNRTGFTLQSFLPSLESFRESAIAVHEYLGLLYYRFRTPDVERSVLQ